MSASRQNWNLFQASSPFGSSEVLSSLTMDSKAECRSIGEEHMLATLGMLVDLYMLILIRWCSTVTSSYLYLIQRELHSFPPFDFIVTVTKCFLRGSFSSFACFLISVCCCCMNHIHSSFALGIMQIKDFRLEWPCVIMGF